MSLPIFKDENVPFQLMQSKWSSELNPLLDIPLLKGNLLPSQPLVSGANTVNHNLGAPLQGWFIVRRRQWLNGGTPTSYDITDTQDNNSQTSLTLALFCTQGTSGNPVMVDLWVY